MNIDRLFVVLAIVAVALVLFIILQPPGTGKLVVEKMDCSQNLSEIVLPPPNYTGIIVEDAIAKRRSVREYSSEPVTLAELSQILWAGQGITGDGKRAAPSAGALYPIELYVIPSRLEGGGCGIYRYVPERHSLVLHKEGNASAEVYEAALKQNAVKDAAVVIIFTAKKQRVVATYGSMADRFIAMEAGHISENILLESVSLGLGAVPIGSFEQGKIDAALGLGPDESVLYLNALGKQ